MTEYATVDLRGLTQSYCCR